MAEPYPIPESAGRKTWAICELIRPDPANAHTGYLIQDPPSYTDEHGVTRTCPSQFDLRPAPPGQDYVPTDLTSTRLLGGGGGTVIDRVTFGDRPLIPLRWETTITPGPIVRDWMSLGTRPHGGNSLQMNERIIERNIIVPPSGSTPAFPLPGYAHHNPNAGGAGIWIPFREAGGVVDPLINTGGAPLHYRCSNDPDLLFEAGQIPMEFGGDPGAVTGAFHGNDNDKPAIWWLNRMFVRLRKMREFGGVWYRWTRWSFSRFDWKNSGISNPIFSVIGTSIATVGRLFDEAYVYDMRRKQLFPLPGFAPVPLATGQKVASWSFSTSRFAAVERDGFGGPVLFASSSEVFNSGYLAIILRESTSDFSVALAGKIHPTDVSSPRFEARSHASGPTNINISQNHPLNAPAIVENNVVTHLDFNSSTATGRRAGWVGAMQYLRTGLFNSPDNVIQDCDELHDSGILDDRPETDLPQSVIDDTEFPPESWRRNGRRRA